MLESKANGPARAEIEIEVRYAETDQMGVVHHANYLVWFELARTRLCSLSGYHYAEIEQLGYFMMVTGAHVQYRQGARYGDTITVASWIDRLSSRGLTFAYDVTCNNRRLATGSTDHVWVETSSNTPKRMPEVLRRPFEQLASGDASVS